MTGSAGLHGARFISQQRRVVLGRPASARGATVENARSSCSESSRLAAPLRYLPGPEWDIAALPELSKPHKRADSRRRSWIVLRTRGGVVPERAAGVAEPAWRHRGDLPEFGSHAHRLHQRRSRLTRALHRAGAGGGLRHGDARLVRALAMLECLERGAFALSCIGGQRHRGSSGRCAAKSSRNAGEEAQVSEGERRRISAVPLLVLCGRRRCGSRLVGHSGGVEATGDPRDGHEVGERGRSTGYARVGSCVARRRPEARARRHGAAGACERRGGLCLF